MINRIEILHTAVGDFSKRVVLIQQLGYQGGCRGAVRLC